MSMWIGQEVQSVPPAAGSGVIESGWRCRGLTLLAMNEQEARERFARYFGWIRVPEGTVIEKDCPTLESQAT